MLEKINSMLNVISCSSIGVYIGHTIYEYWHYRKYPGLYALQSAPWYTSVLVYGAFTVVVLLVVTALKYIIRRKLKL